MEVVDDCRKADIRIQYNYLLTCEPLLVLLPVVKDRKPYKAADKIKNFP